MEPQAHRCEVEQVKEEGIEYAFLPDCVRCKFEGNYYWWAVNIPDSVKFDAIKGKIRRKRVDPREYHEPDAADQYWDEIFAKYGYPKNYREYFLCVRCYAWLAINNEEMAKLVNPCRPRQVWYGEYID